MNITGRKIKRFKWALCAEQNQFNIRDEYGTVDLMYYTTDDITNYGINGTTIYNVTSWKLTPTAERIFTLGTNYQTYAENYPPIELFPNGWIASNINNIDNAFTTELLNYLPLVQRAGAYETFISNAGNYTGAYYGYLYLYSDNSDVYMSCQYPASGHDIGTGSIQLFNKNDNAVVWGSYNVNPVADSFFDRLESNIIDNRIRMLLLNETEKKHYVIILRPGFGHGQAGLANIRGGYDTENAENALFDFLNSIPEAPTSAPDPYDGGGTSSTGGGTGDFDLSSDAIDIPALPTLSAADTGFITLFNPSLSQLKSLANFMWATLITTDFTEALDALRKVIANPIDCILGLSLVPVNVPSGGAQEVKVGGIGTGVSMTVASGQYVALDCGTLNVNEFWGGYLDYSPYTKIEISLPYIGTKQLNIDDVMGKSVHLVYHIDILSGECIAYVKCGQSVLYQFSGACATSIPVTGDDFSGLLNNALSLVTGAIGAVATGGLTAATAASALANTASTAASSKPTIDKSGAIGGMAGMLAIQQPYLILTRPKQCLPTDQNTYTGYPSFVTANIGDLSGYTQFYDIHLDNLTATTAEKQELDALLKQGVII